MSERRNDRLRKILELGVEFSQVHDIDILLEKVLQKARVFTSCDAGSIYVREGALLRFRHSQNDTLREKLAHGRKLPFESYAVPVDNKSVAGYVAARAALLNISDVYKIDTTKPYSFNPAYDKKSGYRTRSVLTIPMLNFRGSVIGVLQLINAKNSSGDVVPFKAGDESLAQYFANTAASAIERALMTREIILRMNRMAEMRDPMETGSHVNRVASVAVAIYEQWALRDCIPSAEFERSRDMLRMAALLHDVGKVAIPDAILKKPGRLDAIEYEEVKRHVIHGAKLFSDTFSDFDETAATVVLNHHERWDGKGYPGHIDLSTGLPLDGCANADGSAIGKAGDEIPLFGRIVALADVFDALSSRRSYKSAWTEVEVLDEVRRESGGQFDPALVECLLACIDEVRSIFALYPD